MKTSEENVKIFNDERTLIDSSNNKFKIYDDNLITDKQAAKILGVTPRYLAYQWCTHRGTQLQCKRIGGHKFYRREDVEAFKATRAEKKKHSRKKRKSDE